MRIAVDAMGGDFAPTQIVSGAIEAANTLAGVSSIILVGDRDAIHRECALHKRVPETVRVHHASEVVEMNESPANAVRRKRDSSINRAIELVKTGEADAMISAGNSGAVVAGAALKLRTIKGIERPAIATVMPTPVKPFVLIDAGANTDCSAELLFQFAVMGAIYARELLGYADPLVGLMSVGTEDSKGTDTTKEAFRLLSESHLTFRGNIEGHDLFKGEIDVAVCDGFVGNVILKTSESVAHAVGRWIKNEFSGNIHRKLGALLLTGAMRVMKGHMNPELYGGAPLLGVNGVCIISHGSSSAMAIFHAIRVAVESVEHRINHLIEETLGLEEDKHRF